MIATPSSASDVIAPIGVFDSGMGGLSVLREIRTLLPREALRYVADAGFVPYGHRSQAEILVRSQVLVRFLVGLGAKAVVVACNTATAAAVPALRGAWPDLPIIAMEPAVKPAVAVTRSGVVGVLATEGTLASARFAALLSRHAGDVEVITQPCPGLVDAVERGDLDGPEVGALLRRYITPLLDAGADTLILGCTHYPFLRERISGLVGAEISLVDTGAAVARELQRRLTAAGQLSPADRPGDSRFWTTGDAEIMERFLQRHWPEQGCAVQPLSSIDVVRAEP
ncbi:MAG: glutamate racemase [Aquisalimonadaceae bacterium]